MSTPEFFRPVDLREADGKRLTLTASEAERAALSRRFEIVRIDLLEAEIALERDGPIINARGRLIADIVQSCAVSAEDLPVTIREPLMFRFVPETQQHKPDEEIELAAEDCDEIEYSGGTIDLGEAVAQSLALAIDPFAVGPDAERIRREGLLGDGPENPFAALKGLIKKD